MRVAMMSHDMSLPQIHRNGNFEKLKAAPNIAEFDLFCVNLCHHKILERLINTYVLKQNNMGGKNQTLH